MIVDTMTFKEIAHYLWNDCFNWRSQIIVLQKIHKKKKTYKKSYNVWLQNRDQDDYFLIFSPIKYTGNNNETLITVPYTSKETFDLCYVQFVIFRYRNHKYVAMSFDERQYFKGVMFYSWHTFQRYAERFLGEENPVIDETFIGDVLVYNQSTITCPYTYKGRKTYLGITRDGGFICDIQNGYVIAKTFISRDEYFDSQRKVDEKIFSHLKLHELLKGYELQRG